MKPIDERALVIEKLLRLEAEDVEKVLIFIAGMDAGKNPENPPDSADAAAGGNQSEVAK